jgi:uracil-DNA glycosylase family 4
MLIGDIPMRAENRSGRPCDGLPGEELDDTYLRIAGLQRDEVYVSLVVQCRQEKGGQDQRPGEKLIQTCGANHLPHEIESVSPEVIVLMGAVTCNAIGIRDLDLTHGRPQYVESGAVLGAGWEGWVVPMYSAAAGMRDTRFMIPLLEDWTKLGQWLQGKRRVYPSLTKKRLDYRLLTGDNVWDHLVMQDESFYSHLPLDTESDEGRVWSLQFSPQPGQAYMIRADDDVALQAFRMWFGWNYEGRLLMHHAIHDLDELDQLRIKVREHRDTMQELYHLGHLPQGLKAAVYRGVRAPHDLVPRDRRPALESGPAPMADRCDGLGSGRVPDRGASARSRLSDLRQKAPARRVEVEAARGRGSATARHEPRRGPGVRLRPVGETEDRSRRREAPAVRASVDGGGRGSGRQDAAPVDCSCADGRGSRVRMF